MTGRGMTRVAAAAVAVTLTGTARAPEAVDGPTASGVAAGGPARAIAPPRDAGVGLAVGWPLTTPEWRGLAAWDPPGRSPERPISILPRPAAADALDGGPPAPSPTADATGTVTVARNDPAGRQPPADRPVPPADDPPADAPTAVDPPTLAADPSPFVPAVPASPSSGGGVPSDPVISSTAVTVPEPGGLWTALAAVPLLRRGGRLAGARRRP